MKHYNQPETMILQINAQTMQMQSASGPGPAPVGGFNGRLGSMKNTDRDW